MRLLVSLALINRISVFSAGKTQKIISNLLITILLASPVCAQQRGAAAGRQTFASGISLVQSAQSGGSSLVASPGSEYQLGRSLELPASEFFTAEREPAVTDDFELRLPEESLPDSDIPLTLNSKVEYSLQFFQTRGRAAFARWLSRSERYIPMMKKILRKEGMPEDLVYVAMIESGFSPHAYSVASAVGPWQFMSATGKRYALRIDDWIDERRDPIKSSVAAALYLKELYALFNNDWYLAAAGYNAGENKILRAIDKYNSRDFWQLAKGSYLKRETKDYVPRLLAAAIIAKEPAKYGFADVAYLPPLELDTVTIPSRTDLELLARLIDVPYQALRELNPELRRWCTPPDYADYQLKIPKGKKSLFEAQFALIPADQRYTERIVYTSYRATKRDTLATVARRFNTSPEKLAELNKLGHKAKIRGRQLLVPTQLAAAPAAQSVETAAQPSAENAATTSEVARYYTIKKGDTLASLARRFNVSAKILAAWNNVKGKMAMRPGKKIIVAKYTPKDRTVSTTGEEKS